jgi:phenylacetate-CoA ligase
MSLDPITVYRSALERTPAYGEFLSRELGALPTVTTLEEFQALPLMDKKNYLTRFPLERLCLDGSLRGAHVICRSSGTSGKPFYWPQLPDQERDLSVWLSSELEDTFSVRTRPTLVVVALALGAWISGELATWTLRTLAMEEGNITLLTPGLDREEVVTMLETFSPHFSQTIIYSYPPFAKNIIETARERGIPVEDFDIRLRLAGEGYSEHFREYVNGLLGHRPGEITTISSGYASTDFGRIGKETLLSVTIRRILHERGLCAELLGCDTLPSICQFNPSGFFLETVDGELVVTKPQAIPLVRYRSGDRGEIVGYDEMLARFSPFGIDPLEELRARGKGRTGAGRLPFVLVHGRSDGGITFYGANIPVTLIRDILEGVSPFREHFTGNFRLRKSHDERLDPIFELFLEEKSPGWDPETLPSLLAAELSDRSSEYATVLKTRGAAALPVITPMEKDSFLGSAKIRYIEKDLNHGSGKEG